MSSYSLYVSCLQTFRALHYIEFNIIPFLQGLESFTGDGGKVTKNIFTVLLLQKSEPL